VARIVAMYDAPAGAAATAGRRPLALAFVTPLPPEPSGVATYDLRLAEALARRARVTCFVPDPHSTTRPAGVTLASIADLADEVDSAHFDEVLYAIGNHPRHGVELTLLRQRPGAVLLHDVRLVGAYAGVHAPGDALADELQRVYPGRYPHDLLRSGRLEDEPSVEAGVWLVQEVAERATAVLTHSQHAADLVRADVAGRDGPADALDVGPLAHPSVRVSAPTPASSGVAIVSAGVVHGSKQADRLVEAFGLLAARHPSASLWFAGPVEPAVRAELTRLAGQVGVGPRVVLTGRLESPEYERVVGGATVAVQLRESSNGESSAAVTDVLALGVPTVVTDDGALAELPDEVAVKVPRSITARELADVLDALLGDGSRRAALTIAARRHASEHGFDQAADRIVQALFGPTRAGAHPPVAHETIHAS
jgi:glycosyltransferase involved in cell wall biosynthesis